MQYLNEFYPYDRTFFLLVSTPLLSQQSLPYFDHLIPIQDGVSLPVIHSIYQDSTGFIWITSPYGLARYDGREYLLFRHDDKNPDSLTDGQLFSVLEDTKGRLWITTDKGLDRMDRETGQFIHYLPDPRNPRAIPSGNLRAVVEDLNGDLWLGSAGGGLIHYNPATGTFQSFRHDPTDSQSPSSDSIWALHCDQDNRLWIGTHEGLLDCLDIRSGRWTHHNLSPPDPSPLHDSNIWDICSGGRNSLLIATSRNGLVSLDIDSGALEWISLKRDKEPWQADHIIFSLALDSDGLIWMGTHQAGIFCYHAGEKRMQRYTVESPLPGSLSDNSVISIFEDREGLLWFGTGKGISLLNKDRFRFPLVQNNPQTPGRLSDNNVLALHEDGEGIVWISTAGGLDVWDKKTDRWNPWGFSETQKDFRENPLRAICEDRNGRLWFGSRKGLYGLDRKGPSFILIQGSTFHQPGLSQFQLSGITAGLQNDLWMVTRWGQLFRWDPGEGRAHLYSNSQQRLNKNWYNIYDLHADREGGIWTGQRWHGLDYLDPQTQNWRFHRHDAEDPHSVPSDTVYSITEDVSGRIWIGTEAGPAYYDAEEDIWINLADRIHLPHKAAVGLLFDAADHLWMSGHNHLYQIDLHSQSWRVFGPEDGLQDGFFNPGVCAKGRDGGMYFGGTSGFNHFHPDDVPINTHVPHLSVTAVQTSTIDHPDPVLHPLKLLKISSEDLPVTIKMAALSFAFPQKNYYRVLDLNRGNEIIHSGADHTFTLRNLKKGKNRFLIQGSKHDRIWNEKGLELTVVLASSFSLPWMIGIGMLLIGGFLAGVLLKRRQRFTRMKQDPAITAKPSPPADTEFQDLTSLAAHYNFTKRELEIVRLVIQGKTNAEIEAELFISLKTVKSHLYNIYRKLKVKNRLQLMNAVKQPLDKNRG